jgi:hypothetical protein
MKDDAGSRLLHGVDNFLHCQPPQHCAASLKRARGDTENSEVFAKVLKVAGHEGLKADCSDCRECCVLQGWDDLWCR